ncbi:MAG: hypothetical protein FH756_19920 [Firmicutes bacterium]|nr:hypothetical protein [Bacillota bacterium]
MSLCPLCNHIREQNIQCSCGNTMRDSGPVTDYYGPYSPYFNLEFESHVCHHLFACPECGQDMVVGIPLEESP